MHLKTRTWAALSLFCFLAGGYFWHLGDKRARQVHPNPSTNPVPSQRQGAIRPHPAANAPLAAVAANPIAPTNPVPTGGVTNPVSPLEPLLAFRLSNTRKPVGELMRSDRALLLRNALLDTAVPADLQIPDHLRSQGDPGSYVVQARGPVNAAFRARLQAAGASIISYIPNNAFLVRASAEGAAALRQSPLTQTVLPWEPYYKLDLTLLPFAVQNLPLPDDMNLGVLVFPGEREAGAQAFTGLGAEIIGEDRSPFGHQLFVKAPPANLAALARLSVVQAIEPQRRRQPANDLVRPRVGVADSPTNTANYLDLTGANVVVSVNDSGVDATHPDLQGRVFGLANTDPNGHGTHVGGTIAGDGSMSASLTKTPPGSVTNANYRGMAPAAKLFTLPLDLIAGPISDAYVQETVARSNIFVSNNSWGYVDAFGYDQSAASYDAATRDALPGIMGSQPLLLVFAAGNSGAGSANGLGGVPGTIVSPAGAKNVITVGAFEQPRRITNEVIEVTATGTNITRPFLVDTDSSNQVARFSSRGNVGIGIEGPSGRFKPDLVAPGTFVISCRSDGWQDPTGGTGVQVDRIQNQLVQFGQTNLYTIFVPDNAVQLEIRTLPNPQSPVPFPDLPIYARADQPPDLTVDLVGYGQATINPITPGNWFYAIGNTNPAPVHYNVLTLLTVTNATQAYYAKLKELNDDLKPWYRYESGTSQSAASVSGIAALMQEMFEQRLGRTNSPALMKALLINGARSLGTPYSLQANSTLNYQGWGRVVLSNSLPSALAAGSGTIANWPIVFFDQDPTTALTTGESHTRTVTLPLAAQAYPLRVTLVWTDPPGNPAAGLKLVNDLDLLVTNRVTGEYYVGNNFPAGSDFTQATDPRDTNTVAPPFDMVNNVENVFINRPLSASYDIIVRARRVNVNAVTANLENIAQDYALVIASGNSRLSNATPLITVSPPTASPPTLGYDASQFLKVLTANTPLLKERVGANSPLLPLEINAVPPHPSNGASNQWNFYVFQHNDSVKTNVAILTFMPPNMSRPRYRDADIDLYVATEDFGMTNLDDTVIQLCAANASGNYRSSRRRGGTEFVAYVNPPIGTTYYIGVKSEDQQAAEFGILALETAAPFGPDQNGNYPLVFTPPAADIPDGSPEDPGGTNFFAVTVGMSSDTMIRRVVLTNTFTHQRAGDLLGNLSFQGQVYAVLNNHRSFEGPDTFVYDDSGENDIPGSRFSDGPGTLRDLVGQPIEGVWTFTMIDNALYQTGRVDQLIGLVEVETNSAAGSDALVQTIAALSWRFRSVNVPPGVTNMIVWTRYECGGCGPPCPLEIYIRRGDFPDRANYDKAGTNDAPGGTVSLGVADNPPLQTGRYYIGTYNPNNCSLIYTQGIIFEWGLKPVETTTYTSTNTPVSLFDDALTNNIITVTNFRTVADVSVGVRLDHPRASDLVLHLTSPQGTRILLYENRGSTLATNLGFGDDPTNFTYAIFTERTNLGPPMKFAMPPYGIPTRTNLVIFTNGFENAGGFPLENAWQTNYSAYALPPEFADTGEPGNKWVVLTNNAWIITDTNAWTIPPPDWVLPRTGSNVLSLNDARIWHVLPTVPDHDYILRFAHRKVSSSPTQEMVVTVTSQMDIFKYLNPAQIPTGTNYSTAPVWAPKLRVCPGQEVSITVPTNCLFFGGVAAGCFSAAGDTNRLFNGLPLYSLVGCWAYAPCDGLTTNTWASYPFYIGTNTTGTNPLAKLTAPTVPGDYYLFLGVNSDVFNPNLNTLNVTCRWQQCQTALGDFVIAGVSGGVTNNFTNTFVSEFYWQTNETVFRANPFTQELIFQPRINTTILLDSVELIEPLGAYFLPEESMAPFQGEFAQGDWKLEVWDDRVGTSLTDMGRLLSWSLDFVFSEPLVLALTNGIAYCDVVRGDEVRYFVVEVPREVTWVTNEFLSPNAVELLYNPSVLPGTTFNDPLPPQVAPVRFAVTTNTPPPGAELRPGQHFFLAVRNQNPGETNAFCLRIDFNIPVIDLPNFGSLRNNIPPVPDRAAMWTNSYYAVTNMQYYRLQVTGPDTNLITAVFQIGETLLPRAPANTPGQCRALPGDVNLVLRRVLPVVDHFPRPNFFDYESTLCGLNQEVIFVNSNSFPVRLRPGAYYLGVYNNATTNVCYRVFAGFYTNVPLPYTIVDLGPPPLNSVNPNFPSAVTQPLTTFYRYPSEPTAAAMAFQLYKASQGAELDLIVRRADFASPDLYEFSFVQDGSADEAFCLKTNNMPNAAFPWLGSTNRFVPNLAATNTLPFLNATNATNWFLAVVNTNVAGFAYDATLCVNVVTNQVCLDCDDTEITPPTPLPGVGFRMGWNAMPGEAYVVEQSLDLRTWTPVSTNVAPSPSAGYTVTNVFHGPTKGFYRVRQVR